jgi:hypothetical protein
LTRPKAPTPPRSAPTPDEIRRRKRAHREAKVAGFSQIAFAGLVRDANGRPMIDPDPNRSPELKAAIRSMMTPAEIEEFGDIVK